MSFHTSSIVAMIAESASLSQPVMLSRICLLTSPTYAVCAYLKSLLIRCADIKGQEGSSEVGCTTIGDSRTKGAKEHCRISCPTLERISEAGACWYGAELAIMSCYVEDAHCPLLRKETCIHVVVNLAPDSLS